MQIYDALAIILLAALVHASFQLSVSLLTLLNSHAIGRQASHITVLKLTGSFVFGVVTMTTLALCTTAWIVTNTIGKDIPEIVWAAACGLMLGIGVAIWAFYYRKEPGTTLWLPRSFARYLMDRTKLTSHSAEAFGLGMSSVIAETFFIAAPMIAAGLVLTRLEPLEQLLGVFLYVGVSALSLMSVVLLIGSGHRISNIQKWREDNKRFIQFSAGCALLILGVYVYIDQVLGSSTVMAGGL